MWTNIEHVHDASSTQIVLARSESPKIFSTESLLLENVILGFSSYATVMCANVKQLSMDNNKWEELATDRSKWRSYLQTILKVAKENIIN